MICQFTKVGGTVSFSVMYNLNFLNVTYQNRQHSELLDALTSTFRVTPLNVSQASHKHAAKYMLVPLPGNQN